MAFDEILATDARDAAHFDHMNLPAAAEYSTPVMPAFMVLVVAGLLGARISHAVTRKPA